MIWHGTNLKIGDKKMITTDKIRYNIGEYLWNYWQNNNNIESIRNAEKTLRNEIEIGLRRRFKDFCEYQLLCNKFSFDAVGVNVGDALTFIDGTEVIAAEDNKVSFCGELFTLSGFCKEFMPDDKRTKSNSYRGCAFFFKDGVKLEKLFKDAQKKSLVSSKEEIAAVPDDTPSEPIDWLGKVFIDFKNKLVYKVAGYNTIKYPHYLYTEIRADGSFLWHGGAEKSEFEEMISHCMVIEYTDENTIMDVIHTYLNDVPNEHQASEKCTERNYTIGK